MKKPIAVFTILWILGIVGIANAAIMFTDDFESGNLDQWTIRDSVNGSTSQIAQMVPDGSYMALLRKNNVGTGSLTMSNLFDYRSDMSFTFDLGVIVTGYHSHPEFLVKGSVYFSFFNEDDWLGYVHYSRSTSSFPYSVYGNIMLPFNDEEVHTYSMNMEDILLDYIPYDPNDTRPITSMEFGFSGYSSYGHSTATEEAQLWIDNVTVEAVPIPGAVWLLGSGLIGLVGFRRKRRRNQH